MMQVEDNPDLTEATGSKAAAVDLLTGAKIVEGITESVNNFTTNLSQGIINVDNAMQSFVNQMGQGQGLAEAIRGEYAETAAAVIEMGGTQKEAAEIQTKTLDTLGRNVILSKEQSKELFAAYKISNIQIDVLEKSFINAGKSIKDIGKEMLMVREVANNMGVNAKAVSQLVVNNLDKLNRYGFQNGVEGLAKMAASSQGLGVNMEETLDFADGLMSPERAVEMAAFFQRMGVASEELKNPLKLIDMTYNNVEGLQDALGEAYSKFTLFNKETGQFEIAKDARNKIKQIQQETGQSREYIEKMALSYANMKKKLNEISFSGFDVDEDTKKMIANVAEMNAGGDYTVKVKQVEDGKEVLVEKSIQELLEITKGDKNQLKELLGQTEPPATSRKIEDIATDSLSFLDKINTSINSLVAQPGLTAGASKAGEQLLRGTYEATKAVNEPFKERLKPDSEIAKSLDNFGVKLEGGITTLKEGGGYQELLDAFTKQGAEFGKTVVTELTAGGIEVLAKLGDLTGLSQLFSELEITQDVKDILDEIKNKGGDLSEEAKKYFDDLLNEIEKKENTDLPPGTPENTDLPPGTPENTDLPPGTPENTDLPPGTPENTDLPPGTPKGEKDKGKKGEEPDEERAKETIEKLGNKAGELYDELKSSILDFFREIVTDKIDVKELNILGGEKEKAEKIEPIPDETTTELRGKVDKVKPEELTNLEDAVIGIKPEELTKTEAAVSGIKPLEVNESVKPITSEEVSPTLTSIDQSKPEGILPPVELIAPEAAVGEVKPTGQIEGEKIINPLEDLQLQNSFKQLQELVDKGLVSEPFTNKENEALFNQELPEVISTTLTSEVGTKPTEVITPEETISVLNTNQLNVETLNISKGLESVLKTQETSISTLNNQVKETTQKISEGQDRLVETTELQTELVKNASKETITTENTVTKIKPEEAVTNIKPTEAIMPEDALSTVTSTEEKEPIGIIPPVESITPEAALPSITAIAQSEEGIIPPVEVVEPKITVTPTPEVKPEIPKQTKEEPKEDKGGFLGKIADKITGIGDVAQNIKGLATFDQGTITNLIAAAGKEIIPQLAEISKLGEKEQGAALQNLVKETLTPGKALKLLGTENEGVGEGGELDINAALSDAISENKELFQGEGAVDVKSITDMLEKNMGGIIDTAASTFKESGIAKLASKFLPKEMVGEEEGGLDKLVDQYAKTAKEMAESTDLDSDLIAESISQAAEGKTVDFEQIAMGSYGSALMGPYEETPEVAEIEEVGTIEESIAKAKEEKEKNETESPEKVETTLGEEISTLSVNELNVEKLNISTGLEGIVKLQEDSVKNLSEGLKETTEQIATGQDKILEGTEIQTAVIESKEKIIAPEDALPKEVKTETTIEPEAAIPSITAIAQSEEGIIPPVEVVKPEDVITGITPEAAVSEVKPEELTKTEASVVGIKPEDALPNLTEIPKTEEGIIPPVESITPEAALPSITAIAKEEEGIIPPVEVVEPKMTVTPTPEVLPEVPKEKTEKPTEEKEGIFGKLLDKVTNVSDIAKNVKGLASMDQGTITNLISAAGKDIIPKLSEISAIKDKKEQTSALQGLIKETMTPSKVMDLLKTENKGVAKEGEEFNLNTALSDAIGQNKELLEGTDVKGITEMLESNMGGIIDTAASTFKDSGIGKLASKFGFDVEGQVDEYANMAKDVAETSDLDSDLIAKAVSDAASGKEVDFEGLAMGSYQEAYAPEVYEPESIFTETEEPFAQIQEETPTLGGEIPTAGPFTEITEEGIVEPAEITQPTAEEEITKLGEEIKTLSVNELNVNNLKITSGLETIIQGQEDSINLLGENILDSNDTLIDNQDKLITEADTQTQIIESVNQEIPVEEVATNVIKEKITPEAALPSLTEIAQTEEGIIPPVEAIKPEAALPSLTEIAQTEEGIIPPVEAIKPEAIPIAEVKNEIPKKTEKEEKVGFFDKIGNKIEEKVSSIGNIAKNVKGLATMDQGTITNLISAAGKDIIPKLSEIAGIKDEGKQSEALQDLVKTTLTPEKAIELLKTENKGTGEGGEFNLNEALTSAIGENKELLEGTDVEGITNMLEKNMGGIIDTAASTFKDSGIGKLASKFGFDVEGQVDQYAQTAKETAEETDLDAEGIASMVEKAAGGENVDFESAFMEGIYPEEEYYTEEPTYEEPVYEGIEPTTYENEVVNAAPVMEPTLAPLGIETEPFDMAGINERVQQFLGQETVGPRGGGEEVTKGETVRIEAKITIDGDPRFASLLDPRKLQETIEGVMTKSIGKPQFAQKVSTGTERASMGLS